MGNNDHNIVRIQLNLRIKKKENVLLVPDYRKANFANIKRKLESLNWNQGLDETYKTFRANFKSIVYENIPHKPRSINNCKPLWMTDCLQKTIADKRKAYK